MHALQATAAALTAVPNVPSENTPTGDAAGGHAWRRRHSSAAFTSRYARFAHSTATIVTSSTIFGRFTLTASTTIALTPTTIAGSTGVRSRDDTRASAAEHGRQPSRDIANTRRTAPACTASAHTNIANSTSESTTRPNGTPSAPVTIDGRPPSMRPSSGASSAPAAISADTSRKKPSTPAAPAPWRNARGAVRPGFAVSSASDPAVSNPYITYDAVSAADASSAPVHGGGTLRNAPAPRTLAAGRRTCHSSSAINRTTPTSSVKTPAL